MKWTHSPARGARRLSPLLREDSRFIMTTAIVGRHPKVRQQISDTKDDHILKPTLRVELIVLTAVILPMYKYSLLR